LYGLIAGPDPKDPITMVQPKVHLKDLDSENLSNLTIGVYEEWFNDASPDVVKQCRQALQFIQNKGAKLSEFLRSVIYLDWLYHHNTF
jgi:Asp-tRNA(Asn)/Glu-tRNA(Gln) amidotransferase A subunit family amidase